MKRETRPLILMSHPLFPKIVKEELSKHFRVKNALARSDFLRHLPNASGVISLLSDPIDKNFLARAPRLRAIANYAVGTNNIDLEACSQRGIRVANTPEVLTRATAELALTLLLAVARRVPEGEALCRKNQFQGWDPELLLGLRLEGRRALIVGGGRIGKEVARLFTGIGLRVKILPKTANLKAIKNALQTTQVLSLHLPYTKTTHHWLDQEKLSCLPKDAIVLNTARGAVHDEKALIFALQQRKIFGAGLDVYEREPEIPLALRTLPNVVLLPHLGSATLDTREAMTRLACRGIRGLLLGRSIPNEVHFKGK